MVSFFPRILAEIVSPSITRETKKRSEDTLVGEGERGRTDRDEEDGGDYRGQEQSWTFLHDKIN